jgi:hypothetical protein
MATQNATAIMNLDGSRDAVKIVPMLAQIQEAAAAMIEVALADAARRRARDPDAQRRSLDVRPAAIMQRVRRSNSLSQTCSYCPDCNPRVRASAFCHES